MTTPKEEVGEMIRLRLEELGLSAAEFARRAGVGYRTVMAALNGETTVTQHRGNWERVLGWEPGSLYRAYTKGEAPRTLDDVGTIEEEVERVSISRKDYEDLMRLAQRLLQEYPPPEDEPGQGRIARSS